MQNITLLVAQVILLCDPPSLLNQLVMHPIDALIIREVDWTKTTPHDHRGCQYRRLLAR
jgi:hypothetical protein